MFRITLRCSRRVAIQSARRRQTTEAEGEEEDKWPKGVPLQGQELRKWMGATNFDSSAFFNGVIQAYGAVAHVNVKEKGEARWTLLPVDDEARRKIEHNKDKKNPFNNCVLSHRVAHPDDQLLTLALKNLVITTEGEQLATVKIWVASFPEALFGEDVTIAEKLFKTEKADEDSQRSLGTKFLELLYGLYIENEQVPTSVRNKAIEAWEEYRESWRSGQEGHALPLAWLIHKFLERQPKPKRLKEWIFRKDLEGNWSLFDLKVTSGRVVDGRVLDA